MYFSEGWDGGHVLGTVCSIHMRCDYIALLMRRHISLRFDVTSSYAWIKTPALPSRPCQIAQSALWSRKGPTLTFLSFMLVCSR